MMRYFLKWHSIKWHSLPNYLTWFASAATVFCVLTVFPGCGPGYPPTAPVSGKVTLAGKPLNTGKIVFYPTEGGRSSIASIGADGTYKLKTFEDGDGALIGHHKVTITAKMQSQNIPEHKSFEEELKKGFTQANFAPVRWIVSAQYARRQTSPLEADVVLGKENVINFDIPK